MATLLFISVLCGMFLEQYASEKPPNASMTYSAATDLKGQMFSVNRGGWVQLYSSGAVSVPSFTVCLRHLSEVWEDQSFFSLSFGSITVSSLSYNYSTGGLRFVVGGAYEIFRSFFNVKPMNTPWNALCATWMSSSGMAQVWRNGMTSVRKGIWRNQVFSGQPVLTVNGFVGQMTDVHVWNYILSPGNIISYSMGSSVPEGTVLSWRKVQYNTGGYVILEPVQFTAGLGNSAELGKANQHVVKKMQLEKIRRKKVMMGKRTKGVTVL